MGARRRTCYAAFALCGCTETAEVLTKRTRQVHEVVTPATEDSVSRVDAGNRPSPSVTSEPLSTLAPTSASDHDGGGVTDGPPDRPPLEPPPLAVGAGHNTTCVIFNQSRVSLLWCFGEVDVGPIEPPGRANASNADFVAVAVGERHVCALDERGEVFCWGDNSHGQLGAASSTPDSVARSVRLPRPAVLLSAGAAHVCAVLDTGELYCWGSNLDSQLGVASDVASDDSNANERREPALVDVGPWVSVAAGDAHTCGVKSDGTLSCWGRNLEQQSGSGEDDRVAVPTLVNTEHSWRSAAVGHSHSCGLRTDGTLWCWGSNADPELAYPLGPDRQLAAPTQMGDGRWVSLSTSAFHACSTADNGDVSCWGRNDAGQLGTNDTEPRTSPTVTWGGGLAVATGRAHSCVVSASDVLCAGSNELGQLGLAGNESRSTFTSLRKEWQLDDILRIDP